MSKPFYLNARVDRLKDGRPVFYVRYRAEGRRTLLAPRSTGETDETAARAWAVANQPKPNEKITTNVRLSFGRFSQRWFEPDHEWVRKRLSRGQTFSPRYLEECRRLLGLHFYRFQTSRLTEITPVDIDDWLTDLAEDGYSASLINHCLQIMRAMMAYALFKGFIKETPCTGVEPHIGRTRRRDAFRRREVSALLDPARWQDHTLYAFNTLSATTGMRMGECQALQRQHVHLDGKKPYVAVVHSWGRKHGLGDTKTDTSMRDVPIPARTVAALRKVMLASHYKGPEDLVFPGDLRRHRHGTKGEPGRTPVAHKSAEKALYAALEAIGIKEVERRERNLCFHSHRHTYNTLMRAYLPERLLRSVVGHADEEMTEHYYHPTDEDFKIMQEAGEQLFA